jgi:hypothetical protein
VISGIITNLQFFNHFRAQLEEFKGEQACNFFLEIAFYMIMKFMQVGKLIMELNKTFYKLLKYFHFLIVNVFQDMFTFSYSSMFS